MRTPLQDYDHAVRLWKQAHRMPDPPQSKEDHNIYLDLLYWSRKLTSLHRFESPGRLANGY